MDSNEQNIYCLDLESRTIGNLSDKIQVFNPKTDLDECVSLIVKDFDLPSEEVRNFLLSINANKNTIAQYILKVSNKIVAHGAVVKAEMNSSKGMLNAIHATENSYLKTLVDSLSIHCKESGIRRLYISFTHLNKHSPKIKPYKKLGFVYTGKFL
ncbi:MAG: hypothetical protein ACFFC6_11490 [Promethearchaeota archaeon]